jgi:glycosyltransferase involved in cell wall biosynthesis
MPATAPPRVSVIVPSYNSARTIGACLDSLLAQDTSVSHEIIVADSSTDETPAIVGRYAPRVRLVRSETRLWPGPARNLGMRHASGQLFAFTDTDCVVPPGWINAVDAALREHEAAGGRILNGTPESAAGTALYLCEFVEFGGGPARQCASIPSCNVAYRRTLLESLGGFPAIEWGEEYVLNHRIAGGLRFEPSMAVSHLNRTAFGETARHARKVGHGCALSRRATGQVAFLFRFRALVPLLFGYRLLKISGAAVRTGQAIALLRAFPLLLVDLAAWTAGFHAGTGPAVALPAGADRRARP